MAAKVIGTTFLLFLASGSLLAHNDVTSGSSHLDTSQATAPPPDVTRDVIAQNETEAEIVTSQNSTHDDSEEMTQMTQSHTADTHVMMIRYAVLGSLLVVVPGIILIARSERRSLLQRQQKIQDKYSHKYVVV